MMTMAPVHGVGAQVESNVSADLPLFSATVPWSHEHTMHPTPVATEWLPHVSHGTADRSTSNMIQSRPAKHLVARMRKMPSTYF